MAKPIGFVGVGFMGKPMARNLLRAGYPLIVHDINRGPVQELVAEWRQRGLFPQRSCPGGGYPSLLLCRTIKIVEEVFLGKDGIIEGIKSGRSRGNEYDLSCHGQKDCGEIGSQRG